MRYGEFKRGTISQTEGQIKKHYSQFTKEEYLFLKNKLQNLNKERIVESYHLSTKFIGYDIDVVKELPYKDDIYIIEYNQTPTRDYIDRRILVRSKESYDVNIKGKIIKCNLCVVFSIVTNEIITIYWNKENDNHRTLNTTRYNKDLKIIY